jgi:hypothetical protein
VQEGGGGGLLELPAEHISLPHAIDNLHLDEHSDLSFSPPSSPRPHRDAGSNPHLHQQRSPSQRKHGTFLDITSSPSLPSSSSSSGDQFDTFTDLFTHDGAALDQVSACYRVSSRGGGRLWGLCGSPLGDGILACEL